MNILLIAGGWSSERDVALNGAKTIAPALEKLGHNVSLFDPENSLEDLFTAAQGQDFAFINLHGSPGEDGLPQAMLDRIGLPYQGSGPAGSFLALNKAAAKGFFRRAGLATPDWVLLSHKPGPAWQPPFPYPLFIKSNTGGSSLALERVANQEQLQTALERLFALGGEFIMEPACSGQEVTCGVLGELVTKNGQVQEQGRSLPPILIRPLSGQSNFFDYTSKYKAGAAEEICPAPFSAELTATIQDIALKTHNLLGLSGYSRCDFILSPEGTPWLLEVNTLPGMTSTSLIPQEAAAVGISFEQLLARLIQLGLARAQQMRA